MIAKDKEQLRLPSVELSCAADELYDISSLAYKPTFIYVWGIYALCGSTSFRFAIVAIHRNEFRYCP